MADDGDGDLVAADLDEVAAAGSAMVTLGDAVERLASREILGARWLYGSLDLAAAAGRFSDRYGHLVQTLGTTAADAGDVLRDTASAYRDVDIQAPITQMTADRQPPPGQVLA